MNGNIMASPRHADYAASESKTVSASTQPKPQLIAAIDSTDHSLMVLEENIARLRQRLSLVLSPTISENAVPSLEVPLSSVNHSSTLWQFAERLSRANAEVLTLMENLEI